VRDFISITITVALIRPLMNQLPSVWKSTRTVSYKLRGTLY